MKEKENAVLISHLQVIWSIYFVRGDSLLLLSIYSVHLRLALTILSTILLPPYSNYSNHHVFPSSS